MENEETAANPVDVVEEPQVVNLDAETEANTQAEGIETPTDDLDALLEDVQAAETEDVEIEYEGEKFKVAPVLKDAFLRDADYRRKTMDLSEQRKTLETREQFVQSGEAFLQEHAQLIGLDQQIKQLEALDVTGWSQAEIDEGTRRLELLRREAGVVGATIQNKKLQFDAQEKAENAKLRQAAIEQASKIVPKFNEERRTQLENLAVELGVDEGDAKSITDASAYKILHLADIGQKFLARQSSAAKMKTAQAGNPTARLGGMADGGKQATEMSMAEYIAARSAGRI